MGKYMRKCKLTGGDVAVMEVTHHQIGVRTRARTLAMAAATASAAAIAVAATAKKKKNDSSSELSSSSYNIQLRSRRRLENPPEKIEIDSCSNTTCRRLDIETENYESKSLENSEMRRSGSVIPLNDLPASRCSSNGSSMLLMNEKLMKSVVDLEGDGSEIEENSRNSDIRARRETTPSSNLRVEEESDDLASTEGLPMMPSETEIDDFFSVPEKQELQRFEKKYNFDFVKEVPLEGRYEWVPLIQ